MHLYIGIYDHYHDFFGFFGDIDNYDNDYYYFA